MPSATANAVPPVAPPQGGPSQPLPYRDDHFGSGRRDPKYDRYDGYDRGRNRDDYYEDRRDFRGDFRGGPPQRGGGFRGRGRGRWDDRERFPPRNRERDWDPSKNRRSRSRSPPRGGRPGGGPGRRDDRYSPPRRPITTYISDMQTDTPPRMPMAALDSDKDEFGRDLRPQSPTENTPPASAQAVPSLSPQENGRTPGPPSVDDTSRETPVAVDQTPQTTSAAPPSAPSTSALSNGTPSQDNASGGLDAIDMTAFNPTDPSSWEALGKAWAETHGSVPSQEELMQYVMAGMGGGGMGGYSSGNQYGMQQQQQQPQGGRGNWSGQNQSWGYSGRGRGRGRGRGGNGYGNGRNGQWGYSGGRGNYESTDAVMLGGGEEDSNPYDTGTNQMDWQTSDFQSNLSASSDYDGPGADYTQSESSSEPASGRTGKMQRVGDRWVFVRADAPAPPAAEVA